MLCKWKQTEGGVAIYFKTKILSREKKEGIMYWKREINQPRGYNAPNIAAPKYIKQIIHKKRTVIQ